MRVDVRPIVLIGPPGAGKSTVGRALAAEIGRSFADLDLEVERAAGCEIAAFFAAGDEAGFRVFEHDVLRQLLHGGAQVIATGAGVVAHPVNRALLRRARCVFLDVDAESAAQRLSRSRPRPKTPDAAAWAEVVQARAAHYAELGRVRIDTSARSLESVIAAVGDALASSSGRFVLPRPPANAPLPDGFSFVSPEALGTRLDGVGAVIVDAGMAAAWPTLNFSAPTLAIDVSGDQKGRAALDTVVDFIIDVPRTQAVALIGGGALLDVGGLAAHLAHRGHPTIAVPTTRLAMVDATLGGKVAIDHPSRRNGIGAFHAPRQVLLAPGLLRTLSPRARRNGAVEMLKHILLCGPDADEALGDADNAAIALAKDAPLEEAAEAAAVQLSLARKAAVVALDPLDFGARHALNLGHTFAHALEATAKEAVAFHGETVAAGLCLCLSLSVRFGGLDEGFAGAWRNRLLPTCWPGRWPAPDTLMGAMRTDKKRVGTGIPLVLLEAPGIVRVVHDLDQGAIAEHIEALSREVAARPR